MLEHFLALEQPVLPKIFHYEQVDNNQTYRCDVFFYNKRMYKRLLCCSKKTGDDNKVNKILTIFPNRPLLDTSNQCQVRILRATLRDEHAFEQILQTQDHQWEKQ